MSKTPWLTALTVGIAGLGAAAGLFGSAFGLLLPWLAALALAVGALLWAPGRRLLGAAAVGIAFGAAIYLGLGLTSAAFELGSPGSGSGGS